MKTAIKTPTPSTLRSVSSHRDLTAAAEQSHRESVEALVERASRGDRNAVTAIAIAYRWVLLGEARVVLGPYEQDAEDVLQELLLLLLEGRWPYAPGFGPPGKWLRATVRRLAEAWRADREREWDGPPDAAA
jgi:DNA-directed RNA polymerase specialized sigma24 family protein